jgi:hypothetical protein
MYLSPYPSSESVVSLSSPEESVPSKSLPKTDSSNYVSTATFLRPTEVFAKKLEISIAHVLYLRQVVA